MDAFVEQLTEEQAIALAKSGKWKDWDSEKIVKFQLFQKRLCMDFSDFHAAMEEVLGRPVWTHGFASQDNLIQEYLGLRKAPTQQEMLDMLPADKTILVDTGGGD